MSLATQVNVVSCGAGDLLGTGQQACAFDWDRIRTIEISKSGYAYTTEQTLASIQEAQQKEEVFIISNMESCKLVPVELKISTSEGSGAESVDGELPYKYELMFKKKGVNFWKALRRFNSNGIFNISFYDIEGNKIFTQTKGGIFKGFGTNMLFTGQYKGQEGDSSAEFKMSVQLSDVMEMERQSWVSGDTATWGINDLAGYNDIILTPAALAVAGTVLTVEALLADKSHFAEGMVLADFAIKKGGVPVVATLCTPNATNKTYALTIPAATAGTYTIETTNSLSGKVVLQAATGLLYKSNVGSVIVV
jgi:hypothetical protein